MTMQTDSLLREVERVLAGKRRGRTFTTNCPFHQDSTPSFVIYLDDLHYYCFGCKKTGRLETLFGKKVNVPKISFKKVEEPVEKKVAIKPETIEYWSHQLKDGRDYFYERGFGDAVINRQKFGFAPDYDRYVIPIWDGEPGNSEVYSVKLRSTFGDPKYIGLRDFNAPALYNKYLLRYNPSVVVICFGELDALSFELMGVSAVSPTAGAGSFKEEWIPLFSQVDLVLVLPDNTPSELEAACELVELFGSRAQLGYFPEGVKDGNEYYLEYKTIETFWQRNLNLSLNLPPSPISEWLVPGGKQPIQTI